MRLNLVFAHPAPQNRIISKAFSQTGRETDIQALKLRHCKEEITFFRKVGKEF